MVSSTLVDYGLSKLLEISGYLGVGVYDSINYQRKTPIPRNINNKSIVEDPELDWDSKQSGLTLYKNPHKLNIFINPSNTEKIKP